MGDLILWFLFVPLAALMLFNATMVLIAVNGFQTLHAKLEILSGAHLGVNVTVWTLLWDSAARSITLYLLAFVPVVLLGGMVSGISDSFDFNALAFPMAGIAGLVFGLIRSCLLMFKD